MRFGSRCSGKRISWLGGLLLTWSLSVQGAALRVCASDWPPFTVPGEAGQQVSGILAERVTKAFRKAGYDAVVHVVAWERCLRDLADGFYAAAYPAAYRKEREAFLVYSASRLETLDYVAVVRKGAAPGWRSAQGVSSLPQPVGVPRAWALAEDIAEVPGLVLDQNSETMEQNLRKLKAGHLGTALVEVRTAQVLLPRIDPQGLLEVLPEPALVGRAAYLVFSRQALGTSGARQIAERAVKALAGAGGGER